MPSFRPLVFAILPLFAGCQMLNIFAEPPAVSQPRYQGELSQGTGHLLFKPCTDKTSYAVTGEQSAVFIEQAHALLTDTGKPVFADLSGTLKQGNPTGAEGQLVVSKAYRLQGEGPGCKDPNFKNLLIRASGNEPFWNINISSKGMVLERLGQPALALPYLEEQLPDGGSSISTDANGLKLELWLTPQTCTDSMSGSIQHLTAELNFNGEILRGCGSYGAMRSY